MAELTLEAAYDLLRASSDFRVARRLPPASSWTFPTAEGEIRRALFVDVETTGLDHDEDEVIELAILPFTYDARTGAVLSVDEAGAYDGLREPSIPIPPETTLIHGLSAEDVAGQTIDEDRVDALVSSANLVIAHNAAFDRPMVEKHWDAFKTRPWACSLIDIDWRAEGLSSGKLDYLLGQLGWFYDGHRALVDALAGVKLLASPLPGSAASAMLRLLENARRPLKGIRALDAPYEARTQLKKRGYKWDPGTNTRSKSWWRLVEDADAEFAWLRERVFGRPVDLPVRDVPATLRFSDRIWR